MKLLPVEALRAAVQELKNVIAKAEQLEARDEPSTFEEREALYLQGARHIINVYKAHEH